MFLYCVRRGKSKVDVQWFLISFFLKTSFRIILPLSRSPVHIYHRYKSKFSDEKILTIFDFVYYAEISVFQNKSRYYERVYLQ